MNMYYWPRYTNGELVPISWLVAFYRRQNKLCWPLEFNANRAMIAFDYFCAFLGFISYAFHEEASLRYVRVNFSNITEWPKALPIFIIFCEIHLRSYHGFYHKNNLRRLLQKFYTQIYVSKEKYPEHHKVITKQLRFVHATAVMYILSLSGFLRVPIQNIIFHSMDYLYLMIPSFDVTPLYIFIPFTLTSMWVAIIINSMLIGELSLISEFMMHINARYVMIRQDLQSKVEDILENGDPMKMAKEYKYVLIRTIRKNVALNDFIAEIEEEFTFRVFVMFAFSAALLCVLSFMAYTNPKDVFYIFWFLAKTFDLIVIGNLGSILEKTTNDISKMYYECNWEQVIYKSNNSRENVQLMKLIVLSIEINSKPVYLTGMKYFRITLQAVLRILQGAFSYFTFLTSMGNKR